MGAVTPLAVVTKAMRERWKNKNWEGAAEFGRILLHHERSCPRPPAKEKPRRPKPHAHDLVRTLADTPADDPADIPDDDDAPARQINGKTVPW